MAEVSFGGWVESELRGVRFGLEAGPVPGAPDVLQKADRVPAHVEVTLPPEDLSEPPAEERPAEADLVCPVVEDGPRALDMVDRDPKPAPLRSGAPSHRGEGLGR